MSVRLLPLTTGHVPAWNALLARVEEVERTGEHYNEDDLLEEMANPDITLGKDLVGAFDGDDLLGYFGVYPRGLADDEDRFHLEGTVRPDRRGEGIGTLLARAMMARAREAHADTWPDSAAAYLLTGDSDNADQRALMADLGLTPERWTFVMRAALSEPPQRLPLPDGLEVRPYDDWAADLLLATHNTVFRDHPNFTPWTPTMWAQWVTGSRNFRPGDSFVVVDRERPNEIAAYVQTNEYDAYTEATGRREAYVAKVGTRRGYRGIGVATALLVHCLHHYADQGYDEAALDVDSQNPTGALGVYERAGFAVERKQTNYALREPAPARAAASTSYSPR